MISRIWKSLFGKNDRGLIDLVSTLVPRPRYLSLHRSRWADDLSQRYANRDFAIVAGIYAAGSFVPKSLEVKTMWEKSSFVYDPCHLAIKATWCTSYSGDGLDRGYNSSYFIAKCERYSIQCIYDGVYEAFPNAKETKYHEYQKGDYFYLRKLGDTHTHVQNTYIGIYGSLVKDIDTICLYKNEKHAMNHKKDLKLGDDWEIKSKKVIDVFNNEPKVNFDTLYSEWMKNNEHA